MDETALRVFLSLAQTENTRDTAAHLRVNQSNVSRALARLEADTGMTLFTRRGKRLELNARGRAFRGDAAGVLDALEGARRHADVIAADTQILRVGFLHSVARWLVPDVIQTFRTLHPDIRVSLRQGFSRDLYSWLDLDAIDVALTTAPSSSTAGVHWRALAEEPLCLAVPDGHPLSRSGPIGLAEIEGADFIGFSRIAELHDVVAGILAAAKVTVNVTFESSEIDTMRSLVAGGLGLSILPRTPGRADPGVAYVPLADGRTRQLGIGWSDTALGAPLAGELAARLVDEREEGRG